MDFEKILKLRQEYPIFSGDNDALYDSIKKGEYKSDYALLTMSIISKKATDLLDLYKDKTAYSVKKGNSTSKLAYVVDQCISGLEYIRN